VQLNVGITIDHRGLRVGTGTTHGIAVGFAGVRVYRSASFA
jgi:hypothetical protein